MWARLGAPGGVLYAPPLWGISVPLVQSIGACAGGVGPPWPTHARRRRTDRRGPPFPHGPGRSRLAREGGMGRRGRTRDNPSDKGLAVKGVGGGFITPCALCVAPNPLLSLLPVALWYP